MELLMLLRKFYLKKDLLVFIKVVFSLNVGTVAPLIGIGFQASAMFFTYEFSKRLFTPFK